MRASIAVVQGDLRNRVLTAALVDLVSLLKVALIEVAPGADAIDGLGTLFSGALVIRVSIRACVSVVCSRRCNLVQPAPLVVVSSGVVLAIREVFERSHAVHRLSALILVALNVCVSISACIPIVGCNPCDLVRPALLVDVLSLVIKACSEVAKVAQAVHRLGAALRGALLEGLCIRAAEAVVSTCDLDVVDPAAPVLVVITVMEAAIVLSPGSNTVNRLVALLKRAFLKAILVRALLAIQGRLNSDGVGAAALVLVARSNMLTATIRSPLALAVHRLPAARLGALLK